VSTLIHWIFQYSSMIIIGILTVIIFIVYLLSKDPSHLAILVGNFLLMGGIYNLNYFLPKITKDVEIQVSIETLRASFWIIVIGLIITLLGILNLLHILPHF